MAAAGRPGGPGSARRGPARPRGAASPGPERGPSAWRGGGRHVRALTALCALLQEARAQLPQDEARALQRPLRDQGENR